MNGDLTHLIGRCRSSAQHLTSDKVLSICRAAAEQQGNGRVRTTQHSRSKRVAPWQGASGRNISWSDLREALLTAADASWQEEHGTWRLTGGRDIDGDALTVAVVVALGMDDVYVWTAF